jgi:hypothetical protein
MGPDFNLYRSRIVASLVLLIVLPLLIGKWANWVQARKGISELGVFGRMNKTELDAVTTRREAVRDELMNSRPYIDVMHDQIGDSLAESERDVVEVIEQIGILNSKATLQREHIAKSIKSGRELTETTHLRIENNRQIIAAIEMQLGAETDRRIDLADQGHHIHRPTDQSPRTECRDRGGAGRQCWTRLCRGGV